jgi:hypothetical protein
VTRRETSGGALVRVAAIVFALSLAPGAFGQVSPDRPAPERVAATLPADWKLGEVIEAPSWLRFALEHRARFEHLENDFHVDASGDATALSFRTLFSAELGLEPVFVGAELQDARAYATDDTRLDTTHVNPLELLQAYVSLRRESLLLRGDAASVSLGRITIDLGSRRLVARNVFRNTVNAFGGLDLRWKSPRGAELRAIATWPVLRRPGDGDALGDNRIEIDRENPDVVFGGGFFGSGPLASDLRLEAYALGLHERDGLTPTANRRLLTQGARLWRPPAAGELDLEAEAIGQIGCSRATTAPDDDRDLAHRAAALHVSAGYRFATAATPRLMIAYDFASGDDDPDDDLNGRFDTLFGARRWEYGPTGIYGPIPRANMGSPSLRAEVAPHASLDAFVAYRMLWLASARDAWTPAGLRDRTGGSGTFVGQQIEGSLRWRLLEKHLSLEIGGAGLIRGGFARRAPGARDASPGYFYGQITTSI